MHLHTASPLFLVSLAPPLSCALSPLLPYSGGGLRRSRRGKSHTCFVTYWVMGGCCGGCRFSFAAGSSYTKGRLTTSPGVLICTSASSVARNTAIWPAPSPGIPTFTPPGRSMAARRGTPHDAVRSGMCESVTVLKPAASILRCTSPTDQQQTGQIGTRTTQSTCSW